jgi:hypothetical protein
MPANLDAQYGETAVFIEECDPLDEPGNLFE